MPPATSGIPAMYMDMPQRFGQPGGGAYPLRAEDTPVLTAAAWAQHQLMQSLRVWVVAAGYSSPRDWISRRRVKSTWRRLMRGEQWVTLEDLAFLAQEFGEPAERQVGALVSSLSGQNLPQAPTAALPPRPPRRISAMAAAERARNGLAKGGFPALTATDSVWMALNSLAERERVQIPRSLLTFEGEGVGLWGEPGRDASVTLPDPEGPPLRVIDDYYVLKEPYGSSRQMVIADLVRDSDGELMFTGREAFISPAGTLDFVPPRDS